MKANGDAINVFGENNGSVSTTHYLKAGYGGTNTITFDSSSIFTNVDITLPNDCCAENDTMTFVFTNNKSSSVSVTFDDGDGNEITSATLAEDTCNNVTFTFVSTPTTPSVSCSSGCPSTKSSANEFCPLPNN